MAEDIDDLILQAITITGQLAAVVGIEYIDSHYFKTLYHTHTSILSVQGWVQELLDRHPEHICSELGVHWHVSFTPWNQAGGAACHILVHLHHWSVSSSCWGALPEIGRHHIIVSSYLSFLL